METALAIIGSITVVLLLAVLVVYLLHLWEVCWNNRRTPPNVYVTRRGTYKRTKPTRGEIRGKDTDPHGVFSCDYCHTRWVDARPATKIEDSAAAYRVTCPVCGVINTCYPTQLDRLSEEASWLRSQGRDL